MLRFQLRLSSLLPEPTLAPSPLRTWILTQRCPFPNFDFPVSNLDSLSPIKSTMCSNSARMT
jgi:hypothetical protein